MEKVMRGLVKMITYKIEVKMADRSLKMDKKIREMLSECAQKASSTFFSVKNKRSFVVADEQPDEYTAIVYITTRDPINPTRSMSAITRAVTRNEAYYSLVKDHIVNNMIFQTTCIDKEETTVIHQSDTEIVSEIISIFFSRDFSTREKNLARDAAEKIRNIVLEYINGKNEL